MIGTLTGGKLGERGLLFCGLCALTAISLALTLLSGFVG